MDLLWLIFIGGLAALPPRTEIHKQLILASFAIFQLFESSLLAARPRKGRAIAVGVKIGLATLLIGHTGQVAINSSYYPIYYIPVVTAAMLFGPLATLGWTALASGAYCAYLWPALRHYSLNAAGRDELALRLFFFFLLALIINRFVRETSTQRDLYREAAESLQRVNHELRLAQAEARRAERLAALGQMSAGLAHEIRNPLAVIKGSAEMLERSLATASPVAVELAGYISSEVNRVNVLVQRFLDFARPLRIEPEPTELPPLLDQAISEARERWPASTVRVEADYRNSPMALPRLRLDPTLCERAFANLVDNAFQAMEGCEPATLRISVFAGQADGHDGVLIRFADTGPGVAPEHREQIFNPFFTTKPTGVGLGLAIVAKIIDRHGGRVRLLQPPDAATRDARPPSSGACFEVFLPYADDSAGG